MRTLVLTLVLAVMAMAPAMAADNWPQWRGPSLDGTTDSKNLPLSWSESENVKWKVAMPSWSGSTPVIWGDRIFITTPSEAKKGEETAPVIRRMAGDRHPEGRSLLLACYSKTDGSLLWRKTLTDGNFQIGKQNMASPSPITDGEHVWALTGTGMLAAFDVEGKEAWHVDLQKKYGKFGLGWGYGASPLLYGGKLIVPVLHGMTTDDPSYIVAFDPKSGKELWKVERATDALTESPDAYTTPVAVDYGDRTEILISGGDYVTGHDLETGKETWRCAGINPTRDQYYRTVATPVVIDDIVVACAKRGPTIACRIGGKGDVTKTHTAWTSDLSYDVPTPVTDGTHLYILHDRGFMHCVDPKTGEVHYQKQRLPRGIYDASPLLAGDRIYVSNEGGRTAVLATGPEFKVLAVNELDDDYTLASIAVSGDELFIRTSRNLYCIANETKSESSVGQ